MKDADISDGESDHECSTPQRALKETPDAHHVQTRLMTDFTRYLSIPLHWYSCP